MTTYAYLTHPPAAAWGVAWLREGGGEVRFLSPVFVDDDISCTPRADASRSGSVTIDAVVTGEVRATFAAVRSSGPAPDMRAGETLRPRRLDLAGEFGEGYGIRAGDDLDLYARLGVVHPAVWPALANHVVHSDVARGSWVHTRSIVRHHAAAPAGATADVLAVVVDRFTTRAGERAILDVRIEAGGVVVATLEHEAIVALPGR